MQPNIHLVHNSIVVVLVIFILILNPSSVRSKRGDQTPYYDICAPFACGGINFTFPFSDRSAFGSHRLSCGLPGMFLVSCDQSLHQPSIELVSGSFYQVKALFTAGQAVTVVNARLIKDLSLPSFSVSSNSCSVLKNGVGFLGNDTSSNGLYLSAGTTSVNFLICEPGHIPVPGNFIVKANSTCNEASDSGGNQQRHVYAGFYASYYASIGDNPPPKGCRLENLLVSSEVVVELRRWSFNSSITSEDRWKSLVEAVGKYGTPLAWSPNPKCDDCLTKNGRCGFEPGENGGVVCFYKGSPGKKNKWKLIVGVTTGCSSLVVLASFIIKKWKSSTHRNSNQTNDARIQNAQQFIKSYQSTLLTSFSFKDIKKITGGFNKKLGEGGCGNVYKGKLPDGRVVAVKLLDKASSRRSAHDCQDFINEVRTIGTIHHMNVIRLHGYCVDRGRQALVYEYMRNGSLGDALRSGRSPTLGTDAMMNIAVGVAEGVNYLHRGCDSRILHLDIKPQNILLDEGYNPKVSDFGLAEMYSRSKSTITLLEAKGTIGFIAPEIIIRNLGNPSDRSDVYSFGMVLLEMIGVRKHVDDTSVGSSSSRERYFADWIYEELNRDECAGIMTENHEIADDGEEISATRKMIMIGLWCIQINPRDRPSMARVLEMLLGKVESIAMPPKPVFFASSKKLLPIDETESNANDDSSYNEAKEISGVVSCSREVSQ